MFQSGHHKKALLLYENALTIDSKHLKFNAHCFNRRAAVYMALGQPQNAISDLEQSLILDASDTTVQTRLHRARTQLNGQKRMQMLYREQRSLDKNSLR